MIQFENYRLIRNILGLSLIMIHFGVQAQLGGPSGLPQMPVNNVSTPSANPSSTNGSQKSELADGKYSEYQSICRSEIKSSEKIKEPFSKTNETTLLEAYKKDKNSETFKKIFDYYYEYSKIDELKSLFLNESKNLKALDIVVYDSKIKFLRKKYGEVITAINKQLEETPDNETLLLLLAESYKEINNIFEAKSIYQDLIKKNKKFNDKYILNLCALETLDSSHGEAEATCKLATKAFPQNESPRIYLGITYREETSLDKAIEQFKMANNIKPTEFGMTCLAEAYALKQDFNSASEWYKKSFELDPKSGRAILGLALNDVIMKQYESALEHFKKACDLDKKASLTPLKETYKKVEDLKLKIANQYYAEVQRCNQK